jgi:uncharacterized LabA/DUF88 family protein
MESPLEVALFIDFENIRYSVLNTYHRELSGVMLMDIGRRYGRVTLSRAYADFDEHPERVQRDLQISGIHAVNCASLQIGDRSKSGADMHMLTEIFETLLDQPHLSTYVLMTGDRRFIRMVTMIRHRFGKEVVVAGVRGSVSNDLIEAAGGGFEPLEFEPVAVGDRRESFIRFVDRLERSKPFITFKYVAAAMTTSSEFPGLGEEEARELVAQAIQEGILIKEQRADGYRVLYLNRDHEESSAALGKALRPSPAEEMDAYAFSPEESVVEENDGLDLAGDDEARSSETLPGNDEQPSELSS